MKTLLEAVFVGILVREKGENPRARLGVDRALGSEQLVVYRQELVGENKEILADKEKREKRKEQRGTRWTFCACR